ncbi:MAG: hypothetical protein ACI9C4_002637, partial [Paraglaciecola sp.]
MRLLRDHSPVNGLTALVLKELGVTSSVVTLPVNGLTVTLITCSANVGCP